MEGTNGNYEPSNGMPQIYQKFDTGAAGEIVADPQICDPDSEPYPRCDMTLVFQELDSLERICQDVINKLESSERLDLRGPTEEPGSSQSDISQGSMEPLLVIEAQKRKKREKFVPGDVDVIDLTSEDSSDSTISRGGDVEPVDFGQVQGSMATGITAVSSPSRPKKRKQPDPPQDLISLSDDEADDEYRPYECSSTQGREEEKADGGEDDDDALASVWAKMRRAMIDSNHPSQAVQEPIPGLEPARATKKRKMINDDVVWHNVVTFDHPTMQLDGNVNELVQVEALPAPKPRRPRGRPKKDASIKPSVDVVIRESLKKTPIEVNGKEGFLPESPEATQAQLGGTLDSPGYDKEKKKARKGDRKGKEGNEKEAAAELTEDEDEDDEACRTAKSSKGDSNPVEELIKLSTAKVDYEPYIRRNDKEDEVEDAELAGLFSAMNSVRIKMAPPPTEESEEGSCEHPNFDFDEDMGYYCGDCGCVGFDMPTSNKRCTHKNYEFRDEVGYYCVDCGKVGKDIEALFVPGEAQRRASRPVIKLQEAGEGVPQFRFIEPSTNGSDFCEANLQLHPFFEERLHPHQKKGFKFLTENLLGGGQGSSGHESVGCILAHAPGTGKTCLMISFIQSFLSRFPDGRPLIVAPKIMLRSWFNEFKQWRVQEVPIYGIGGRIRDYDGGFDEEDDVDDTAKLPAYASANATAKERQRETRAGALKEWQGGRGVLLLSYKMLDNLVTKGVGDDVLPESYEFQMSKILLDTPNLVVLDEGHCARNRDTNIAQALTAMKTKRRVLLSGTLFQNNFKELYTLLKLCRDDFMTSHPQYGKKIAETAMNVHGTPRYSGSVASLQMKSKKELRHIEERLFTDEIGDKLERYVKSCDGRTDEIERVVMKLQSLTASFVDWYPGEILKSLPGLFEYSIHLNLTSWQLTTIAGLPDEQKKLKLKHHHMSLTCRILAAGIHPSLAYKSETTPFKKAPDLVELESVKEYFKGVKVSFLLHLVGLCEAYKEKLLIFCSTLQPFKFIEKVFSMQLSWEKGREILRLDGTMQDSDRQRVIEQFNSKDSRSKVLMASTKACKEGITLVGASRVVILDNQDNPSIVRQAVSRAFRMGQERKVFVYRLVGTNREEEEIFRRSVNKERLSQVLLDPISTMARFGGFLKEQKLEDIEDELLQKMMHDREMAQLINVVHRYNASQ